MAVPRRYELTAAEWALLQPLLPPARGHRAAIPRSPADPLASCAVPLRDTPEQPELPWQRSCRSATRLTTGDGGGGHTRAPAGSCALGSRPRRPRSGTGPVSGGDSPKVV